MFLPKHVIAPCVVVSGPDHRSDQPKPTAKTCDRTGPCCTRSTRPLWPTILPTVIPMIAVRRHAIAPPCLVSERTTHGQSEPGPSNFERRRQAPVYHPHGLLEANHPKRRLWVGRAPRSTFADETRRLWSHGRRRALCDAPEPPRARKRPNSHCILGSAGTQGLARCRLQPDCR